MCDVIDCELSTYVIYGDNELSLCRWHSYLYERAGKTQDDQLCNRLLRRLPWGRDEAEVMHNKEKQKGEIA